MRGRVQQNSTVVALETYLQVSRNHNDRGRLPENQRRLQELIHSKRTWASLGVDQYARPGAAKLDGRGRFLPLQGGGQEGDGGS